MSLARIRFIQKSLIEKYGVIGIVASRYLEAGLSVRVLHPTRYGPIHIVVSGNNIRLAIEVFSEAREVPKEVVERVVEKAKLIKARPVLVLYGDGPRLTDEVFELCRKYGVKVRRIRAQ
ncbi:MAG TPA: hypothetical protein EYP48_03280 [Ignisphaera sp.]|uniref:Uncharacterized protein n=1 Tax=Ignisphaera aggregans TaxID=334771 RepID=A0A832Z1A2_9CREN|nr:hypothetical protein [Ignisphaera sp.]HIP57601.1 hypothetical protein [Ignisphaera aggregans]